MTQDTLLFRFPVSELDSVDVVDLLRLERSLGLEVSPTGRGRYRVSGGAEPHWVDLYTSEYPRCDCGDYLWRERLCKHILAALLREGDERILRALGRLVAELRGALIPNRRAA